MSTRPRKTVPAKSYVDSADSDVEMGSSGEERGGVERGGKRGRGKWCIVGAVCREWAADGGSRRQVEEACE